MLVFIFTNFWEWGQAREGSKEGKKEEREGGIELNLEY